MYSCSELLEFINCVKTLRLLHLVLLIMLYGWFLPVRRYASAGLCDSNMSVCLSVINEQNTEPVLCQNEESYDFFTIW